MNWASFGYGIAAAFTWLLAAAALASMIGRRLRTQTPAPAASPPRAPGKTPAAGTPPIPREAAAPRPAPLPGPAHGGIVTTVDIYADGRTEITDHRKGTAEIFPGECPACQDGACSLCGFYPVYDRARGRVVHRYQECPAHAGERQP